MPAVQDLVAAAKDIAVAAAHNRNVQIAAGVLASAVVARLVFGPSDGRLKPGQLSSSLTVEVGGQMVSVKRVLPSEAAAGADTLSSLSTDPMMVACAAESADDKQRADALRTVYYRLLKTVTPSSTGAIALRTADFGAVAVALPGDKGINSLEYLWQGGLFALFGFTGWARRGRLDLYAQAVQARRALLTAPFAGKYFYLLLNAAKPGPSAEAARAAVVKVLAKQADSAGVPIVVEVTNAASVASFAALGFSTAAELSFFDVDVAIMVRKPQAA